MSRWWWLLIIPFSVAGVGIGGYAFHQACCRHDLLLADFDSGPDRFWTGETDDYIVDLHEGSYRMTAMNSAQSDPFFALAWLNRRAAGVLVEVTVVDPGDGVVGVGCLSDGPSYLFRVGEGKAELVDTDGNVVEEAPGTVIDPGQRLGIRCGFGNVETLIDGEVLLRASYSKLSAAVQMDMFDQIMLAFFPADEGDSVLFDDVEAVLGV